MRSSSGVNARQHIIYRGAQNAACCRSLRQTVERFYRGAASVALVLGAHQQATSGGGIMAHPSGVIVDVNERDSNIASWVGVAYQREA